MSHFPYTHSKRYLMLLMDKGINLPFHNFKKFNLIQSTVTTFVVMFGNHRHEKKLEAQQGQDNPMDKFAVMVVKENEAVSHFPQVFS